MLAPCSWLAILSITLYFPEGFSGEEVGVLRVLLSEPRLCGNIYSQTEQDLQQTVHSAAILADPGNVKQLPIQSKDETRTHHHYFRCITHISWPDVFYNSAHESSDLMENHITSNENDGILAVEDSGKAELAPLSDG